MAERAHVATPSQAKTKRFNERLQQDKILVMPGGFSPLYARMAQDVGFESFFVAGSQVSAFLYGVPDVGIIGLRDMVDHARHVAARTDIPILVDSDTGYGNVVNVHFAVQEFVRSGVAGLQIEDQEAPKKSGTVAGRRCIPREEAVGKQRAAVDARNALDPNFVICGRCDLIGAEGGTFQGAVDRCVAYVEEGGVDLIWLNTVETREQIEQACRRIPAPVLPLWGGKGQMPGIQELEQLGARVALYPTITASAGGQAGWDILNGLKQTGTAAIEEWAARAQAQPWGVVDRHALVQDERVREIEERFLPESQQRDYANTFGHKAILERD